MDKEQLLELLKQLTPEQLQSVTKSLNSTDLSHVVDTTKSIVQSQFQTQLSAKDQEIQKLQQQLAERDKQPRKTNREIEEEMTTKLTEVTSLLEGQFKTKIQDLEHKLTRQQVLNQFTDLPKDYQERISGQTEEEMVANGIIVRQQYNDFKEAAKKQVLEQLGLDASTDLETLKQKITQSSQNQQQEQQEQTENEAEDDPLDLDKLLASIPDAKTKEALQTALKQRERNENATQQGQSVNNGSMQGVSPSLTGIRTPVTERLKSGLVQGPLNHRQLALAEITKQK